MPIFRHRLYELFAYTHILGFIAYLGTMFWHAGNELDSWIYLWATLAIWLVQNIARAWDKTTLFEFFPTSREHSQTWKRAGNVDVQILEDRMMKVSLRVDLTWSPGQHIFLRIPSVGTLDNHPFTIISTKEPSSSEAATVVMLIRSYNGFTQRLYSSAHKDLYAMIDGPYGGLSTVVHARYEHAILVAGGGGISAVLPWLTDLSKRIGRSDSACTTKDVTLIWCVRSQAALGWVASELREARSRNPHTRLLLFVTREGNVDDVGERFDDKRSSSEVGNGPQRKGGINTKEATADVSSLCEIAYERPGISTVLHTCIDAGRTLVLGCGPESLKTDLSNAVADAQQLVWTGKAAEVSLHTETFGW